MHSLGLSDYHKVDVNMTENGAVLIIFSGTISQKLPRMENRLTHYTSKSRRLMVSTSGFVVRERIFRSM